MNNLRIIQLSLVLLIKLINSQCGNVNVAKSQKQKL